MIYYKKFCLECSEEFCNKSSPLMSCFTTYPVTMMKFECNLHEQALFNNIFPD